MDNKQRKQESLVFHRLVEKLAAEIGAQIIPEPNWGIAGQIIFRNGKVSHYLYNSLDINSAGSARLARDKDYANFFIAKWGFPIVPDSRAFLSEKWAAQIGEADKGPAAAIAYAQRIGFPVLAKPNGGSQGQGVAVAHTVAELTSALESIFAIDRIALIQRRLTGADYRIVVLDDEVAAAYQRLPLSVIGDGTSTISELLAQKSRQLYGDRRDPNVSFHDPRIDTKLAEAHLDRTSIPTAGTVVQLLDNANLSTGGTAIDVTDTIHPEFRRLAIDLTHKMGLRLCGVDLIVAGDITSAPVPGTWWVLEVNSSPGLDHFAATGPRQLAIATQLYRAVLRKIEQQR